MKISELAIELGVSSESIKNFIEDFDLELSECFFPNLEIKTDFEKFAKENVDFLRKYEADLYQQKSAEQIAQAIHQPVEKVEEIINKKKPNLFENGLYKSSISSYGIDNQLGGNYQFVYNYFGNKTVLAQRDFIGYRDLFFYISNELEPIINPESAKNWGINKPAGIVLYGPPGSGKIFWANKIAEIVDYQFKEVKKYYLGTSFVNGKKTSFSDFLMTMMKENKLLLFLEDFDELMLSRNEETTVYSENEETKEMILLNISKFQQEELLMVGSTKSIYKIDEEILAPGRFDILIPIFPPNPKERAEMLLHYMTENLEKTALLYQILEKNNANHLPFWISVSEKMKAFSNTMIIDFTQSLKKRIKNQYQKIKKINLIVEPSLLDGALRDAAAKLTEEYLNQVAQFSHDVSLNNYDDFSTRIEILNAELDFYKIKETPRKSIGFLYNDEEK